MIFIDSSQKQTYLTINNRLGTNWYIFALFFTDIWSSSPKNRYFWVQISPILAPGEVQKLEYWLMFVDSSHKQTYLTTTNRLGTNRYIFWLIFIDFFSSSPKICYFWTQIRFLDHFWWPEMKIFSFKIISGSESTIRKQRSISLFIQKKVNNG